VVSEKPCATFSLRGSLHLNYHKSLMGSQKDKPFDGVESRLHYLSAHMHHAWGVMTSWCV
jgi:hypothetical protein